MSREQIERAIAERYEGDAGMFAEIARAYLSEEGALLGALVSAAASGDDRRLASALHKLRGAAATMHRDDFVERLRDLESRALAGDLQGGAWLPGLRADHAEVVAELDAWLVDVARAA